MSSITFLIIALLVVLREFVDRVVCQMHVCVVDVTPVRSLIRLCAETCKCHLVHEDTQWINPVE
jgi:hypothetical protein